MEDKNWRNYVTDDVTLVFDLDSPCFMAASAQEEVVLKVVHKASGKEVFKQKNVEQFESYCVNPETLLEGYEGDDKPRYSKRSTGEFKNVRFDNRTDFWGRTKVKPTGWLGDLNTQREIEGKEPFTRDDFEITSHQVAGEVSHAIFGLKLKIQQVKDYLGIDRAIYLIGSGDCHRHLLEMPVNPKKEDPIYGQYKGNRGDTPRPLLLDEVRRYAVETLGAKDIKGVECDDVINMYGFKSYQHYKKTGKHSHVLISPDKDQCGFNCMLFDTNKIEGEWRFKYPQLIEGFGELFILNGKVRGRGQVWLLHQMLIGDDTDNYSPTNHFGIKFGEKASYKLLAPCKTLKEAVEVVKATYMGWFPDGVKFTSWSGKECELTWYEWADTIWACAYMLKSYNDKTTFTGVMDKLGVEYERNDTKLDD